MMLVIGVMMVVACDDGDSGSRLFEIPADVSLVSGHDLKPLERDRSSHAQTQTKLSQ